MPAWRLVYSRQIVDHGVLVGHVAALYDDAAGPEALIGRVEADLQPMLRLDRAFAASAPTAARMRVATRHPLEPLVARLGRLGVGRVRHLLVGRGARRAAGV